MNKGFIKLLVAAFLLAVNGNMLNAQERPLGTWKSFMPYGSSYGVFDAGDKVYSVAAKNFFSYEKQTGAIQAYDKATGLSDVGIKVAAYDPATKVFALAYQNSNIDLIYNGTDIYNIADFRNLNTSTTVTINGISFYNGNAYISSDMGISVLDLARKEISNTYIIGTNGGQVRVYGTTISGNTIYAATAEGVKHASLTSANLQNFNNWSIYDPTVGLPKRSASNITAFNNKVYTVIGNNITDTLFVFDGSNWSKAYYEDSTVFTSLRQVNNVLYFTTYNTRGVGGKVGKIDAASLQTVVIAPIPRPTAWFESDGIAWQADEWQGLCKNINGNIERIIPDGPPTSAVFDINSVEGTLYLAPGGVDDSWGFTWNGDGFSNYKNNTWHNTNQYSYPPMQFYTDILCTATSPQTGKTYYGSFLSGLIEVDNNTGEVKLHDQYNTPTLEGAQGDITRTKISSLGTDQYGNVWIGNAGATKPLKMIKPDGTWKQFTIPYAFDLMKKIIVDQNDQIWAPIRRGGEGILVWSYNQTPDDPSDDVARVLRTGAGNGGLPNELVFCVAEDRDGNIWAGTSQGIGVFYCPGSVLTSNGCDADQIKVERDGYIGYLFGTESVRAIAVDAANRKWIGTTNGLWLISDDGKQELLKFTVQNSPLPSNQVTDIAIDNTTGEVFIGTLGGLVSYQGDAMGECADCKEALVYPNPVKPDYNGPIAIKGLTDNAYVKITDVSGTLVYQGKANGNQMIWDGKGYNGARVKTGVYLVFSSTDLGKERKVGKILLSN